LTSEGSGSIFKRTDCGYFVYLPKAIVEDTGFPFLVASSVKVKIRFTPGDRRLIIERNQEVTIAESIKKNRRTL
jgi:hypothetical protein